jgi:hypothetical protein
MKTIEQFRDEMRAAPPPAFRHFSDKEGCVLCGAEVAWIGAIEENNRFVKGGCGQALFHVRVHLDAKYYVALPIQGRDIVVKTFTIATDGRRYLRLRITKVPGSNTPEFYVTAYGNPGGLELTAYDQVIILGAIAEFSKRLVE